MALPQITHNTPTAGSIAWSATGIVYAGTNYAISAGSSAKKFVWWEYSGGAPVLRDGDTLPDLTVDDVLLFLNKGGVGALVPTMDVVDGSLLVSGTVMAASIAADQIQTYHVAANAITTNQLNAGAVTATEIAAGAITTDKLAVGSVGDNLVTNGSFEEFAGGMPLGWTTAGVPKLGSIDVVSGVASSGAYAARLACTATTSDVRLAQDLSKLIPVSSASGRKWYISARVGAGTATSRGLYLRASWYDANKTLVSSNDAANNAAVTTSFAVFEGQVTPPSTARYLGLSVLMVSPSTATNIYVDEITAREVVIAANIGDGQITTPKLVANAITAEKVAAGAITADKMVITNSSSIWPNPYLNKSQTIWNVGAEYVGTEVAPRGSARLLAGRDHVSSGTIPARPGDTHIIDVSVKRTAGTLTLNAGTWLRRLDGVNVASSPWLSTGSYEVLETLANGWDRRRYAITIPASQVECAGFGLYFQIGQNAPFTTEYVVSDVTVRRMGGGELIVDGSIVADKIAANAVVAGKIAADAVTAAQIKADTITANEIKTGTLTSASGVFGEVDAKIINTGTLNAARLNATDVRAKFMSAGKITATELATDSVTATQIKAGSVDLGVATVGKLSGTKIEAKSIGVETLMVGSLDNLVESPGFENTSSWVSPIAGAGSGWSTAVMYPGASNAYNMKQFEAGVSNPSLYAPSANLIPVDPGDSFRVTTQVRISSAAINFGTSAGLSQQVYFFDENKTLLTGSPGNMRAGDALKPAAYVWTEVGGIVTAPAGAVYMRPRLTAYIQPGLTPTNGSVLLGYVKVVRAANGALIVDGTITGQHVDAESVGAKVGAFVEARIDKLKVSGTANIDTAVINKLWADVVRSRMITTDMLIVGQGPNLMADPNFASSEVNALRMANSSGWRWGTSAVAPLGNFFRFTESDVVTSRYTSLNLTAVNSNNSASADKGGWLAVNAGEIYRTTARVFHHASAIRSYLYASWQKADGTTGNTTGTSTTGTGWMTQTFDWEVPADVIWAHFKFEVQYTTAAANVFVANVAASGTSIVRMTDSSLIVDGAITAKKLTVTEEMWANIINFKKLKGDHIDFNTIKGDHIDVGSVQAKILTANAITVKGIISGNALEGTTITGATIQTVATANRGMKVTSAGLQLFDANGVKTVDLNATTGYATLTGRLRTAPDGQPGVVALPSSESDDGKTMGLWFASDTSIIAGGITGGAWLENPAGGVAKQLNLRGAHGAGIAAWGGIDVTQSGSIFSGNEIILAPRYNLRLAPTGGGYIKLERNGANYGASATIGMPSNLYVHTDGNVFKATSASKYKINPQPMELPTSLLEDVRVKNWIDVGMAERYAKECKFIGPRTQSADQEYEALSLERIPGAIAEDVEAAGGSDFCVYGLDGEIEGLMYDRFALARTELLNNKLNAALDRIHALEGALA